jgi:hypothetical protein
MDAWPRLLLKAIPNVNESAWVRLNIIDKKVDWPTAKALFTARVEIRTWTEQSQQLYEQCRQASRESVQDYSDRFMNLVTELGYVDDDRHVTLHFQLGLIPSIQAKIRDRVHLYRDLQKQQLSGLAIGPLIQSTPYDIKSLKEMTDLAINMERSALVSSSMLAASGVSSPSASTSTSEESLSTPSLFTPSQSTVSPSCIHHPNSTSHTTADCRKPGIRENENIPTSSGIGNSSTGGSSASDSQTGGAAVPAIVLDKRGNPVMCYNCGANHYANDKSCPNASGRITRSAASGAQSSAQTSLSSTTRPLQSASSAAPPSTASSAQAPIRANAVSVTASGAAPSVPPPVSCGSSSLRSAFSGCSNVTAASAVISESRATHHVVYLLVNGRMYSSFVDTGAEPSYADASLISSLSVPITPPVLGSKIRLAHADVLTDRSGSVELDATALFSSPEREAISFRCKFELMPIHRADNEYHFIIGRDLIPLLFPQGLPLAYLPRQTSTSTVTVAASSTLVEPPAVTSGSGIPNSARPDSPSTNPGIPMVSSTTSSTTCIVLAISTSVSLLSLACYSTQIQQLLNGLLLAFLLSILYYLLALNSCWWGRGPLTNQLHSLYESLRRLIQLSFPSAVTRTISRDPSGQYPFEPGPTTKRPYTIIRPSRDSIHSDAPPSSGRKLQNVIDYCTSSDIYEYLVHWKGFYDNSRDITTIPPDNIPTIR